MLFSSFRSVVQEKKVIFAETNTKMDLISEQGRKAFKEKIKKKETKEPKGKKETKTETPKTTAVFKDRRNQRGGYDVSKFDLGPLLKNSDKASQECAIRLIEALYKDADFYKASPNRDLARSLIHAMLQKKEAKDLMDLFPADKDLAEVYYKMLKGTNTGYPPLSEYFKIEKNTSGPSVNFAFALTPLLKAAFGEENAQKILKKEKAAWDVNHRVQFLQKEELRKLLQASPAPFFDINDLDKVFNFNTIGMKKGPPQTLVDPKTQIKASR